MITTVATAIKAKLTGLAVTPTISVPELWSPRDIQPPAAAIELPRVARGDPDTDEEAPFGFNGWLLDFPVTLYFDLDLPNAAQQRAVDYLEAFITAVDDDPSLSLAYVVDAAVTSSEPVVIEDRARALIAYECRVECIALVQDNDP